MRFYLSSYKFGKDLEEFVNLLPENNHRLAFIPNAGDPYPDGLTREYDKNLIQIMEKLFEENNINLAVELFDLRDYFDRSTNLKADLQQFGVIWVRGGNVYVLREAMRRSGFDRILKELIDEDIDMLYAGYSAGICVLAENLEGIHNMDDLSSEIYGPLNYKADGLGLLNYLIIPHYDSPNHKETKLADASIAYMEEHNLPYKKLRDGETIIFKDIKKQV